MCPTTLGTAFLDTMILLALFIRDSHDSKIACPDVSEHKKNWLQTSLTMGTVVRSQAATVRLKQVTLNNSPPALRNGLEPSNRRPPWRCHRRAQSKHHVHMLNSDGMHAPARRYRYRCICVWFTHGYAYVYARIATHAHARHACKCEPWSIIIQVGHDYSS